MTTAGPTADRELLEAAARLTNDYFFGLDARDFDAAAACFTDSVRCVYGGIELPRGRGAVVDYLHGALDAVRNTRHLPTSVGLVDTPAGRRVRTHAIAYVLTDDLQVRGLSYDDELVRSGDGWAIADRVHSVYWSSSAAATVVTPGGDALVRAGAEGAGGAHG